MKSDSNIILYIYFHLKYLTRSFNVDEKISVFHTGIESFQMSQSIIMIALA